MKKILPITGLVFLGACYASVGPGGDAEPSDLRHDDPSNVDPTADPFVDPSSDPWYDPYVDPSFDPGYDPGYDPYPDPIYDPWPDGYPCPPGLILCAGVCVDVQNDMYNCGSCGFACPLGGACVMGTCIVTDPCEGIICDEGLSCCYGACVNLMRDPSNCGYCGNACAWGSPDPDLNYEGCMNPDLGIYTLCCRGSCRPVSDMSCGECGARCDEGSSCSGLWDAASATCDMFACMGIFSGSTGSSCSSADDCVLVPSPERVCLTDFAGMALPGGYCTAYCGSTADCGPGGECVDVMFESLCLQSCDSDTACRSDEGYICNPLPFDPSGQTYCIPAFGF